MDVARTTNLRQARSEESSLTGQGFSRYQNNYGQALSGTVYVYQKEFPKKKLID